MSNRIAIGMLCFNRPIHTALTIAFAMHNKSEITDFYAFYGIHKSQDIPNRTLDNMLKELHEQCGLNYYYLGEDKPRNVQGNVDNLLGTLSALPGYSCFAKIDDDVIIGRESDMIMANILLAMEPEAVYMLMGQAVPEHMRRSNPFCWEARVNGHRVVQRAQKACPMETYTFVSMKCLQFLREHRMPISCENVRGTFGPLTRKIVNASGRVCLVLSPAVQMQHIGLTTTIEVGNPARSWAPARSWDPMDKVIEVEDFNFDGWEKSHASRTQKRFAFETISALTKKTLAKNIPAMEVLLKHVEAASDEPAPAAQPTPKIQAPVKVQPVERVLNPPGTVLRKLPDGRVVRSPGPVHRVVIRQPA